jgi:acyl carrier protein
MEEQIKQILANVIGIEISLINENTSSENVKEWDSLKHMNLVIALENELDIRLSNKEIVKIRNFKEIVSCVEKKLKLDIKNNH